MLSHVLKRPGLATGLDFDLVFRPGMKTARCKLGEGENHLAEYMEEEKDEMKHIVRSTHRLEIDGETKTKELTLEPNSTDTAAFKIVKTKEKTYRVKVDGMTETFEVVKSEEGGEKEKPVGEHPLLPIGIGVTFIAIIVATFLYKRRH